MLNELEEKIFDAEVDAHALENLKNSTRTFSDEEVRGSRAAKNRHIELDENDGWE
ncbi:hypothetical protein [uncultured Lactobacillus sp.]|uniref:hypothetical protein n=1 Tax=uncultured Lactobacillus sp. TaxID=153152 RepID=UPI002804A70D|nr:hypothetical protein [uncultured Lactobacillus sp.]